MFLARPNQLPQNLLAASSLRELPSGGILYRRGDSAQAVYVVLNGRLQLHSCTSEGKLVPLYVVRPGECVSEAALFADVYCSDVVAEVPSRLRAFPKEALKNALRKFPELAEEYMSLQAERFNKIRIRLEIRALRSARERVLQYLRLSSSPGVEAIHMDRPLKCLAEEINLSPESFYRTLTQLIGEGWVIRTKGILSLRERTVQTPAQIAVPLVKAHG